ncbi:Lsr2 family protein [Micromonospora aurantiaca]|uniref:Lsr2 dimerization domain-containing protein n=1 Tax=Micromonospora aurantiaca (nom. illeg.) TaxID=47850 RepID=UPI000F3E348D|nr:histone-like nucleoid-structuring protein Lsr2 [Micromonospora aurantiaca]RNH99673.1 Lsr2 family protein [Micromonospora aurantiaca]
MATRTIVVVTDDLDHSSDNVTTHHLALDGVVYEIDLGPDNLQRLREALAPYVTVGRRTAKRASGRGPGTR